MCKFFHIQPARNDFNENTLKKQHSLGERFVAVQMSSAVHEPSQVENNHQTEQETHEESVPQRFVPEDVRHEYRHQYGQNREQYFVISAQ